MTHHDLVPELQGLSEDILRAPSPAVIAKLLVRDLPMLVGAYSVRLYLFKQNANSLVSVESAADAETIVARVDHPPSGLAAAAVRCFRQRTPVNLTSARRDGQVNPDGKKGLPRAAFFAPVTFGDEILGVLEALRNKPFGSFTAEDLAAIKLVADQTGASLKLQEQKQMHDKVVRGEQLLASGELISTTAAELGPAMNRILELCSTLIGRLPAHDRVVPELRAEALRASEIVARLVSFSQAKSAQAAPLHLNTLLNELVHLRAQEWTALGLRVQNRLSPETAIVMGHRGQIEHILLDLAIQAEGSAAGSKSKLLILSSSQVAGRAVIDFTLAPDAEVRDANLEACRGIAESHAGELHLRTRVDATAIVLEIPLAGGAMAEPAAAGPARPTVRALTLMVVDSEFAERQQLLGLLAARGHRVVPVLAEEAAVLAQRMRFDGVIWAVRPGSPKWSDFQERLRDSIPTFVLATSGYDEELASSLAGGGGFMLPRPVQEADLDKLLEALEAHTAVRV